MQSWHYGCRVVQNENRFFISGRVQPQRSITIHNDKLCVHCVAVIAFHFNISFIWVNILAQLECYIRTLRFMKNSGIYLVGTINIKNKKLSLQQMVVKQFHCRVLDRLISSAGNTTSCGLGSQRLLTSRVSVETGGEDRDRWLSVATPNESSQKKEKKKKKKKKCKTSIQYGILTKTFIWF